MKKLATRIISVITSVCLLTACSNLPNSGDSTTVNSETTPSESTTSDVARKLIDIQNDATDLWNNVFCEVSWYTGMGTSSTGEELDIDSVVASMDDYYNALSEDKEYVDALGSEYGEIISEFDAMFDEATIIYDGINAQIPEANSDVEYLDNIEAFNEYYTAFAELVSDLASESGVDNLSQIGDIEVSSGLFTVSITVPASYAGEDASQETVDATVAEKGYISGTYNEDGSVTYVMTKAKHAEIMQQMTDSINESLQEIVDDDETYPNIEGITANDDFTEFTVEFTADELSLTDGVAVWGFYMYGGLYGVFAGNQPDNIHVSFVDADTGELITEANSSDMEEQI